MSLPLLVFISAALSGMTVAVILMTRGAEWFNAFTPEQIEWLKVANIVALGAVLSVLSLALTT